MKDAPDKKKKLTVSPVRFAPLLAEMPPAAVTGVLGNLELVRDVRLNITVELGRAQLPLKEVLQLGDGSMIKLDRLAGEPATPTIDTSSDGRSSTATAVAVALVAAALGAPGAIRLVRRRRGARTVDHQLADAWQRATDAVAAVGVPLRPSDTPTEVAASTARHFPLVTRPMSSLAEIVTAATYASEGTTGFNIVGNYGASTIRDCRNWTKQIERAVNETLTWPQRVRRYYTAWK